MEGENNFKLSKRGIYNLPFRWQRPLGKVIFVLFCCGVRRDEEKETQNINVVGNNSQKHLKQSPKFNSKSRSKSTKSQTKKEKENFCGLWMLCGCNVDAMWIFRNLEKGQTTRFVGLRGGARAPRGPDPRAPRGLGPRAFPNPTNRMFKHFSRLLNIHIASTLHPHSIHSPQKSIFS